MSFGESSVRCYATSRNANAHIDTNSHANVYATIDIDIGAHVDADHGSLRADQYAIANGHALPNIERAPS